MIIFVIIAVFVIISLFAFPRFSPIPYYPSNRIDKDLILKALDLKNDQTIIDLGAGDGWVILSAAKASQCLKLNTRFIAVEINPVLIFIFYLKRLLHPNKKNIKIIWANMFNNNYKLILENCKFVTVYLYISPWLLEKTLSIIKKQFSKYKIVSYMYPMKSLKNKEKIIKGKNNIYLYNLY